MLFIPNIYIRYDILNPKYNYSLGDELLGIFWIENRDDYDKKLKRVSVKIVEFYYKHERVAIKYAWNPIMNTLRKKIIDKKKIIKAGETKEYEFNIRIPKTLEIPKARTIRDWKLTLCFFERTEFLSTTGVDGEGVYLIPMDYHHLR